MSAKCRMLTLTYIIFIINLFLPTYYWEREHPLVLWHSILQCGKRFTGLTLNNLWVIRIWKTHRFRGWNDHAVLLWINLESWLLRESFQVTIGVALNPQLLKCELQSKTTYLPDKTELNSGICGSMSGLNFYLCPVVYKLRTTSMVAVEWFS